MKTVLSVSKVAVLAGALSIAVGCHSDDITGFTPADFNRPVEIAVGKRFDITAREMAQGPYATPPAISSSAVVFLGDEYPKQEPTPGGALHTFHFRADRAGTAVISLTPRNGPAMNDTVVVR